MVIRRVGLCAVAFGSCLGAALGLHGLLLLFDPLASLGLSVAAIGVGCVLATTAVWMRSGQPDRFRVVGAFVAPALVLAVSVTVAPLLLATALGVYLGSDAVTQSFAVAAVLMTLAGAVALVRTRALSIARAVTLVLLSLAGLASFAPVGAAAEPVVLDVTAPMLFGFTNAAAIAVALVLAVAAGAWAAFMYADAAGRRVEAERSLT